MPAHALPEPPLDPSPADHYAAAQELLRAAQAMPETSARRMSLVAEAQLHAQLSLVGIASSAMQPQRFVLGAEVDVREGDAIEDVADRILRDQRRAFDAQRAHPLELPASRDADREDRLTELGIPTEDELREQAAALALTHPPTARPRRRTTPKKESPE